MPQVSVQAALSYFQANHTDTTGGFEASTNWQGPAAGIAIAGSNYGSFTSGGGGIEGGGGSTTTYYYSDIYRGILAFDTSAVPPGATITAAHITLVFSDHHTAVQGFYATGVDVSSAGTAGFGDSSADLITASGIVMGGMTYFALRGTETTSGDARTHLTAAQLDITYTVGGGGGGGGGSPPIPAAPTILSPSESEVVGPTFDVTVHASSAIPGITLSARVVLTQVGGAGYTHTETSAFYPNNSDITVGFVAVPNLGSYTLVAQIIDQNGATSNNSATRTITVAQIPYPPENPVPNSGALVASLQPDLQADFSHPDGSRSVVAFLWEVYLDDNTEGTSPGPRISGGGTTSLPPGTVTMPTVTGLAYGTRYKWRCRFKDDLNQWSPWMTFARFTTNTLPDAPTITGLPSADAQGRIVLFDLPQTIQVQQNDVDGHGLSKLRLQILTQHSTLENPDAGLIAYDASGTFGANPATQQPSYIFLTHPNGNLAWGQSYWVRAKTWDQLDGEGPWCDPIHFYLNDYPTVSPTTTDRLATITGATNVNVSTTTPRISFLLSDTFFPSESGRVAEIKIGQVFAGNVGAPILQTTFTIWVSNTRKWWYDVPGGNLNFDTQYAWSVRVHDGKLQGPWSDPIWFTPISGPSVAITAPTNGSYVTSQNLAITWSFAGGYGGQQSYRVAIARTDTMEPCYDSGVVSGAGGSHTIPLGALPFAPSGTAGVSIPFQLFVEATDAQPATARSTTINFTISYPTVTAVSGWAVVSNASRYRAECSWTQYSDATHFTAYRIYRRRLTELESGGSDPEWPESERETVGLWELRAVLPNITSVSFYDYLLPSSVSYEYAIAVQALIPSWGAVGQSALSTAIAANVSHPSFSILASVVDAHHYRARLWRNPKSSTDENREFKDFAPMGRTRPLRFFSPQVAQKTTFGFQTVAAERAQTLAMLKQLRDLRHTLALLNSRGDLLYCSIDTFKSSWAAPGLYDVEISVTEQEKPFADAPGVA